ncbi:MAG: hypothetical protein ACXVKA_03370 [Acidimicrobiia bacterium]
MKIEDRLHDALHDYADGIEPEPGSWARITARLDDAPAPRRLSRRPLVLAGAALALVVVLITVLAIRDGGGDTRVTTQPSAPSTASTNAPSGVVAALDGGRLVALRSHDGGESSSYGTFTNLGSISSTPDGREVFFRSQGPSGACGGNPGPNINRLDPATGTTTEVMGGSVSPAVSPDGKLLAYGTWCDHRTLGFTNLVSGGNSRTDPLGGTTSDANPKVETVEPLGWSPDSTLLLYRLGLKGDQDPHYYVGRFRTALHQGETAVTALPYGRGITAAAFIDNATVALAETTTSGRTEVRRWTVDTGSQELPSPVMFEVPARVSSLVADASGQHFLAVTDGGGLYRWSRGDARPTKVAHGVTAAAWVPLG